MKEKEQKKVLLLLTVIVCVHTAAFIGGYFLFNRKINELTKFMIQVAGAKGPSEAAPKEIDIALPLTGSLGDPDAPVEMTIISDFQCPYCKTFDENIFPEIVGDYIDSGLVRISYLPFPLESKHPLAVKAAVAATLADESGVFWDYYHRVLAKSEDMTEEVLIGEAAALNLDTDLLKERINSPEEQEKIQKTAASLRRSGISATPSLVINNRLYAGAYPYEKVKEILNEALAKATRRVNPEDVSLFLEGDIDFTVLDVRRPEEFAQGHLEGAVNLNYFETESFSDSLEKLDRSGNYIIYCKSGFRSTRAYLMMEKMGFTSLYNMTAGYVGWSGM